MLCFSIALWNGKDPILKERMFDLTNSEVNHGEDVECNFYFDSTPTHSNRSTYTRASVLEANAGRSGLVRRILRLDATGSDAGTVIAPERNDDNESN